MRSYVVREFGVVQSIDIMTYSNRFHEKSLLFFNLWSWFQIPIFFFVNVIIIYFLFNYSNLVLLYIYGGSLWIIVELKICRFYVCLFLTTDPQFNVIFIYFFLNNKPIQVFCSFLCESTTTSLYNCDAITNVIESPLFNHGGRRLFAFCGIDRLATHMGGFVYMVQTTYACFSYPFYIRHKHI